MPRQNNKTQLTDLESSLIGKRIKLKTGEGEVYTIESFNPLVAVVMRNGDELARMESNLTAGAVLENFDVFGDEVPEIADNPVVEEDPVSNQE